MPCVRRRQPFHSLITSSHIPETEHPSLQLSSTIGHQAVDLLADLTEEYPSGAYAVLKVENVKDTNIDEAEVPLIGTIYLSEENSIQSKRIRSVKIISVRAGTKVFARSRVLCQLWKLHRTDQLKTPLPEYRECFQ